MTYRHAGGGHWSIGSFVCLVLWMAVLIGCSSGGGGGDPAVSVEPRRVGDSSPTGGFPQPNDTVFALASDGNGGVYVGGQFTRVGQFPRSRLAHIFANGSVDPSWDPAPDGPVTALVAQSQMLFVGGSFFTVDGVERWRLAAIDGITGDLAPWNPKLGAANQVDTLALVGGLVYIGGVFDLVNATVVPTTGLTGEPRRNLAAVDAMTGGATSWNPNIFEGEVKALAATGSTVYVGGSFEQVGPVGQDTVRLDLAAFDLTSGLATTWNPSVRGVTGNVAYALHVSDGLVYVGGRFDDIGGQRRENLAAVDPVGGMATNWNLPANDTVLTFFDDGRRLYVGGMFTMIGGQARARLAAVDKATGMLSSWNPDANGPVHTIAGSGGKVFVGGEFTAVNGRLRNKLAVFDAQTGQIVGE